MANPDNDPGIPDAVPSWLANLPPITPAAPPTPGSQSNLFMSGLRSGFQELAAGVGGTAQAIGSAVGAKGLADWGRDYAADRTAAMQASERPDLEQANWYNPAAAAYRVTKMLPQLGGALIGGAVGGALGGPGGAFAGSAAAMAPGEIGGNVEAQKEASGSQDLSQGQALHAIALGVPEAALAGYAGPGKMAEMFEKGIKGSLPRRMLVGGASQAALMGAMGGGQEAVTQQNYTPEMSLAERAKGIVGAALQGGIAGGIFGSLTGAASPIRKVTTDTPNADLATTTGDALGINAPPPQQLTGPLSYAPTAYAGASTEDVQAMHAPWAAKGATRTPEEEAQFGPLDAELKRRTMPGLPQGTGTLFTAEQAAARQPAIDALRQSISPLKIDPKDTFLNDFNAASEPELVNYIQAKIDPESPAYVKALADRYGMTPDGDASPAAERFAALSNQVEQTQQARAAGLKAGSGQAIGAAEKTLYNPEKPKEGLLSRLADAEKLVDIHNQAGDLIRPPGAVLTDPTGQTNLPGMGVANPEFGLTNRSRPEADPGTLDALKGVDPQARRIAVKNYQDKLLEGFGVKVGPQDEADIRSIQAENAPELVHDIKQKMAAGEPLPPAVRKLAVDNGLLDGKTNQPRDLQGDIDGLRAQADALWQQAAPLKDANGLYTPEAQKLALQAQSITSRQIPAIEDLQDLHAKADAVGTQPVVVPVGVAPRFAPLFRMLEEFRRADDPRITHQVDTGQQALLDAGDKAAKQGQLALNVSNGIARAKVGTIQRMIAPASPRDAIPDSVLAKVKGSPVDDKGFVSPKRFTANERMALQSAGFIDDQGRIDPLHIAQETARRTEPGYVKPTEAELAKAAASRPLEPPAKPVVPPEVAATPEPKQKAAQKKQRGWRPKEQVAPAETDAELQQRLDKHFEPGTSESALDPTQEAPRAATVVQRFIDGMYARRASIRQGVGLDKDVDALSSKERNSNEFQARELLEDVSRSSPSTREYFQGKLDAATTPDGLKDVLNELRSEHRTQRGYALSNQLHDGLIERNAHYEQQLRPVDEPPAMIEPPVRSEPPPEPKQLESGFKNFAADQASAMGGKVAWSDDNHALIRSTEPELGKTAYIPVDRETRLVGSRDVRSPYRPYPEGWEPDASVQKKLEKQAEALDKKDARAETRQPNGPFSTDRGDGTVAFTPRVDPRAVGLVKGLLDSVGLSKLRVLLGDKRDLAGEGADRLGLHGSFASARSIANDTGLASKRAFGPDLKDFYVSVDQPKLEALAKDRGLSLDDALPVYLAHEVGHIVDHVAFRNADPETRTAIDKAFTSWYKKVAKLPQQELIKMARHPIMAAIEGGRDMPDSVRNYLTSKSEWMADQYARYATTAVEPKGVLERFFTNVADKLAALYRHVASLGGNKEFMPDKAIAKLIQSMPADTVDKFLERPASMRDLTDGQSEAAQSPSEAEDRVKAVYGQASEVLQRVRGSLFSDLGGKARRLRAGLVGTDDLVTIAGQTLLKTLPRFWEVHRTGEAIVNVKARALVGGLRALHGLSEEAQGNIHDYGKNLQTAPGGMRPDLPWNDPVNAEFHNGPNSKAFADKYTELRGMYDKIQRSGGREALENFLQAGQTGKYMELVGYAQQKIDQYKLNGTQILPAEQNMTQDRNFQQLEMNEDPKVANAWYEKTFRMMTDAMDRHIGIQESEAAKLRTTNKQGRSVDTVESRALTKPLADLKATRQMLEQGYNQAKSGTYIPLTRDGTYFVSGKLPSIKGTEVLDSNGVKIAGKVDPKAIAGLRDIIHAAGFKDVGFLTDGDSHTVMMRVEKEGQMNELVKAMEAAQAKGHLDPTETIKRGYPHNLDSMAKIGSGYVGQQMQAMRSILDKASLDDATKESILKNHTLQLLDTFPDNALMKSMQPRELVHGFDAKLDRNMARRLQTSASTSTSLSMSGESNAAMEAMKQEVLAAKSGPNAVATQDYADEVMRRKHDEAWTPPKSPFDFLRTIAHTISVGASPAYFLTMMSQIPMLGHGWLAKYYGYGKSGMAIGRATSDALQAVKSIWNSDGGKLFSVTEEALRAGGMSEKRIRQTMNVDNRGSLSGQSWTRENAALGHGEGGAWHNVKEYGNVIGLYSEMLPRLIMAYAASDLHDANPKGARGMTKEDFAQHITDSSMLQWGSGTSSRLLGARGIAGPAGNMVFQFHKYQSKLLVTLYNEMHSAIGLKNGYDPNAQMDAAKFLIAHAVACVAIGGTMGLPGAGFFAGAADKLANAVTGKEVDVEGSYRTWLASTFGHDAEEALAKGVARPLLGVDTSHMGEERVLPFTDLLQDKRKFEDAFKDWAQKMMGPAFGELREMYLGGRDMMNGDYLLGATKLLPEALKNPAEAYYIQQNGYVDKNGTKMPIEASAFDIIKKAVGLDPANEAWYDDKKQIYAGLMSERQYREQNIATHLSRALQMNDPVALNRWVDEGVSYEVDHPGMGNPIERMISMLSKHTMQSAYAKATGTVVGQKPMDFGMQDATGF